MTNLHELKWSPGGSHGFPRAILVALLLVAGVSTLATWKQGLDARRAQQEARAEHARRLVDKRAGRPIAPPPTLNATGQRQVVAQIALLNRDWAQLLQLLTPKSERVKLLTTDVNPSTGALRVDGSAQSAAEANAYAQSLQAREDLLANVRLLLLERDAGAIRFEVSAQWKQ